MPPDTATNSANARHDGWQTLKRFLPYLWPADNAALRRRVIGALIMVLLGKATTLALPFAYLHFRSGNIATHVFMGVLAGISFFLLNNVFGYIGNINNWAPWFAAAAPGMLYSLASLAAFGWLVLRQ